MLRTLTLTLSQRERGTHGRYPDKSGPSPNLSQRERRSTAPGTHFMLCGLKRFVKFLLVGVT